MSNPSPLPDDEQHAVLNWAKHSGPALWEAVPLARPFMLIAAAVLRAKAENYGSFEVTIDAYLDIAKELEGQACHLVMDHPP